MIIINNYDSFVYNIAHYIEKLNYKVTVIDHMTVQIEKLIAHHKPNKIIFSPGPGHPVKNQACLKILDTFKEDIPILGVCLGHQIISQYFGARIKPAEKVMHGKGSKIIHKSSELFSDMKNPFFAILYNSLLVDENNFPGELEVIAWTKDSQNSEIMAIKHKDYPSFGIQFHPESILTEQGIQVLENFVKFF